MAVDFGIDPVLIPDSALDGMIEDFIECMIKSGLELSIDKDKPGIFALIKALIRGFEKAITAAFEAMIAAFSVVLEAVKKGVKAPIVFLEKIVDVAKGVTELLAGLPTSIIEFIINKILKPIGDNLLIPIPAIAGMLLILTLQIDLLDIPWEQWFADGMMYISDKFKQLSKETIEQVMLLFKVPIDVLGELLDKLLPFLKIFELILIPIKFAIGLIKSVLEMIAPLLTNIFKLLKLVQEITANPVEWMLGMIGDVLGPVIAEVAKVFAGPAAKVAKIAAEIKEFFDLIFSIDILSLTKEYLLSLIERFPSLKVITPFLFLIICLIKWMVKLLTPETILGLFFPAGVPKAPDLIVLKYNVEKRILTIDDQKKSIVFTDAFSVGEKIKYKNSVTKISYDVYVEKILKTGVQLKKNVIPKHKKPEKGKVTDIGKGIVKKL